MIHLRNVCKKFGNRVILNHLDMNINAGETYVIIGQSGVGKSVTLKNIIGLVKPDSGVIEVFGKNLDTMSEQDFYEMRRQIGVLFQGGALLNWLNVGENIALPLKEHNRKLLDSQVAEIVREKLALVELEGIEKRMPSELSGGMKKRVGLARAIIHNPKIILYDEPTSGLDPVTSNQINDLIISLQKKLGVCSICVTHDMSSAYRIANRIGMLYQGKIVEEGSPKHIQNTTNPIVHQFILGETTGPIQAVNQK